jgi:hypothetical protein
MGLDAECNERADGEPESDSEKNVADADHGGGSGLDVAKVISVNADGAKELREHARLDRPIVGSVGACVNGVELAFGATESVAAKNGRVNHVALQVTDKLV